MLEYFGTVIRGEAGTALGRIWFFRDITERKRAAEALEQSEARFKAIFDNARDGIALTDPETQEISAWQCLPLQDARLYSRGVRRPWHERRPSRRRHAFGRRRSSSGISAAISAWRPMSRSSARMARSSMSTSMPRRSRSAASEYVLGIFRDATDAPRGGRCRAQERGAIPKSGGVDDGLHVGDRRGRPLHLLQPDHSRAARLRTRRAYGQDAIRYHAAGGGGAGQPDIRLRSPPRISRFPCWRIRWSPKTAPKSSWKPAAFPFSTKTASSRGYRGIERDITQRKMRPAGDRAA